MKIGIKDVCSMLIDKITELLPKLTKKQAALGRYLCENMYDAALMNAPMIAKQAGVSEATLTRFVYALGYEGFPSFLKDLRRCTLEARADNPFRQEIYRHRDKPAYSRVFELEKELLDETMNLLDSEMFEKCADILAAADRILLVGGPTHSYLAEYFANFMTLFNPNTSTARSIDIPFLSTLDTMTEKSAAVIFSYPRYPIETQKMAEEIYGRSIPSIAITDSKFSPIIKCCSHYLITPQRYLIFVDPISSAITMLHALLVSIYQKNEQDIKRRMGKYEKAILSIDMFVYKNYNFATKL